MPRFDPSPWNLGLPVGALASACGPVLPLEPIGPTSSLSETDPTAATGQDSGSTTASPCTPVCAPGYHCYAGTCVPDGGCLEFGCCYDEPCCGEGPCDEGGYGCFGLADCGAAAFCENYVCLPIDLPPDCAEPIVFAEVLGPTPADVGTVFALAFVQSDADEARELVIGHDHGAVLVPGPQEAGQLLPIPYNGLVDDIAVADFDGDGDEDLALELTYAEVQLVMLRNDGLGAFTAVVSDAQAAIDLRAGDLDGDGLPDLVAALEFGLPYLVLGVLPNTGGLTFGAPTLLDVDAAPLDIDIGDLDGNGMADVAAIGNLYQQVWYGTTPINMVGAPDWTMQDAQGYFAQMVVADFDGDGVDDLARLVALNGTTLVDAWTAVGGAVVEVQQEWGWPDDPVLSDAGDLDGDGLADLVRASGTAVHVRFGAATAEMFGCGSRIDLPISPFTIAVGDFTGDGAEDVAVTDAFAVQVYAAPAVAPP